MNYTSASGTITNEVCSNAEENFAIQNSNRLGYIVDLLLGEEAIGKNGLQKTRKMKVGLCLGSKARLVAMRSFLLTLHARLRQLDCFIAYASFRGIKDPDNPDKVYKGGQRHFIVHQAPRAWYETLANYMLGNRFKRGKIDQTLFIKKQKGDILLVQVYVDDIIFGSTNKELCTGFEKLIKDKFQMSSMGELTFFLGLQVQQKEDKIFISQDKYEDRF
ncbi:putative ribonuclease H-like domain-containing protein [Tanacetum coccineum]